MTPPDIEQSSSPRNDDELIRLAELLGGGWRYEHHALMPVIVLTLTEAQALEARLPGRLSPSDREDYDAQVRAEHQLWDRP